jgi:hypothetical protein
MRVRDEKRTPSIGGRRGDELVARALAATRVHLLLADEEELPVGVEFGARISSIIRALNCR